jgi:hypothetical protein
VQIKHSARPGTGSGRTSSGSGEVGLAVYCRLCFLGCAGVDRFVTAPTLQPVSAATLLAAALMLRAAAVAVAAGAADTLLGTKGCLT